MDRRYAVFFIPPPDIVAEVANIQALLYRQFGCQVAAKFPVHATLRGLFRLEGEETKLIDALGQALCPISCFPVYINAIDTFERQVLKINLHWEEYYGPRDPRNRPNRAIRGLREAIVKTVNLFVSPYCEFSAQEPTEDQYECHITLATHDLPQKDCLFQELLSFASAFRSRLPSHFMNCTSVYLGATESADWGGQWWQGARWETVHCWRLAEPRENEG